jgi:hypothetical protein
MEQLRKKVEQEVRELTPIKNQKKKNLQFSI